MATPQDVIEKLLEDHKKALPEILAEYARMKLKEAKQETWADREDAFTPIVVDMHPLNCGFPGADERYARALSLVENRHGKYELVDLVNALLTQIAQLEAQVAGQK